MQTELNELSEAMSEMTERVSALRKLQIAGREDVADAIWDLADTHREVLRAYEALLKAQAEEAAQPRLSYRDMVEVAEAAGTTTWAVGHYWPEALRAVIEKAQRQ